MVPSTEQEMGQDCVIFTFKLQQTDPIFFFKEKDPVGLGGQSALDSKSEEMVPTGLSQLLLIDAIGLRGSLKNPPENPFFKPKQMDPLVPAILVLTVWLMDAVGLGGHSGALFMARELAHGEFPPIFFSNEIVPFVCRGQVVGTRRCKVSPGSLKRNCKL